MNLKSLSDHELLESTRKAAKTERHAATVVLHHLLEVQARRLFSPKYESLKAYCVGELKYSAPAAQRRIDAMRVLKAVPEVEEKIESGLLNLTTLSQAQTFFRIEAKVEKPLDTDSKREILEVLESKSTREVERELVVRATEPLALRKDQVRVVSETLSELKCLVKDETLEDFRKLRGLLAHQHPSLSMGELLEKLAKIALEALDPARGPKRKLSPKTASAQREAKPAPVSQNVTPASGSRSPTSGSITPAPASRYVAAGVRREVWRMAHGKCQACGSVHRLQIDHIRPHALGGGNQLGNLRLLCFHCNQREADRHFSHGTMQVRRSLTPHPLASAPKAP